MTGWHLAENIRLGLIGAGPWGRHYINTIRALDGVALTRLASRNPESAALAGPDCEITQDWREMLAAGGLDGVIIATPPALHAEMTLAAIDRDVAVLVEKPMTLNSADAETVLERAQSRGAIVRVDHIHLYSAAWEALKLEAAGLGPLRAIIAEAGSKEPDPSRTPVLWNWGSHDVAMCIDLLGRLPEKATARRLETRETEEGKGETLALSLDFGGVTASITIGDILVEKKRLFTATFEEGELVYDDMKDDKLWLRGTPWQADPASGDGGHSVPLDAGRPLDRAVLAFASAISRGVPDTEDVSLGTDVVRVLSRMEGHIP